MQLERRSGPAPAVPLGLRGARGGASEELRGLPVARRGTAEKLLGWLGVAGAWFRPALCSGYKLGHTMGQGLRSA